MTNPVSFADDIDAKLARLERERDMVQAAYDDLKATSEHELREAALREFELLTDNNRLRAFLREVRDAIALAIDDDEHGRPAQDVRRERGSQEPPQTPAEPGSGF